MPLHSNILKKRWSTLDLPILPFLAPRVFPRWPSPRGRRQQSTAEATQESSLDPSSSTGTTVRISPGYLIHPVEDELSTAGLSRGCRPGTTTEAAQKPKFDLEPSAGISLKLSPAPVVEAVATESMEGAKLASVDRRIHSKGSVLNSSTSLTKMSLENSETPVASGKPNDLVSFSPIPAEDDAEYNFHEEDNLRGLIPRRIYPLPNGVDSSLKLTSKSLEPSMIPAFLRKFKETWDLDKDMNCDKTTSFKETIELDEVGPQSGLISPVYKATQSEYTPARRSTSFRDYMEAFHVPRDRSSCSSQGLMGSFGETKETTSIDRTDGIIQGQPNKIGNHLHKERFRRSKPLPWLYSFKRIMRSKPLPWLYSFKRIVPTCARRITFTRVRSKLVRWQRGRESLLSQPAKAWRRYFALLNFRHESFLAGRIPPRMSLRQAELLSNSFKRYLINHEDSSSLRASWEMIPEADRSVYWPELILMTMANYPDSALKVLVATYSEPFPPDYAVSDCINFIISHYFRHPGDPTDVDSAMIFETIFQLIRSGPPDHVCLSQSSIRLLLGNLDVDQLKVFYNGLDDLGHNIYTETLMHFASQCAKLRETDLAVEILKRLKEAGHDFSTPEMSSVCTSILQFDHRSPESAYLESEIFEIMLNCGLPPNVTHYNVLIHNSIQKGDYHTGWKIHEMMIETGIPSDGSTYSMLLNDAKKRRSLPTIRHIINMVTAEGILTTYIMTDILHSIHVIHQDEERAKSGPVLKNNTPTAFQKMLPVFYKYFEVDQLARLLPDFYLYYPKSVQNKSKMECSISILLVMINAYLQHLNHPKRILAVYDHIRGSALSGDTTVQELLTSAHFHNHVLMALGEFRETVSLCPRVVEDMILDASRAQVRPIKTSEGPLDREDPKTANSNDGDGEADNPIADDGGLVAYRAIFDTNEGDKTPSSAVDSSQSITNTSYRGPEPNIITWNILLNVFMKHHQSRAAERVLELMTARNIQPNLVTWNTLVGGYGRLQETAMAVDAVERLERAGFDANGYTMSGLSRIRDQRALIRMMESKGERYSQRQTLDAMDKLRRRTCTQV